MHPFSTEATRPSDPIVSVARWNWGRRRLYFGLRKFARALTSVMTDVRSGPFKALHDSRSLLAARVIHQHRHLIQDYRCIGVLHCVDDTGLEAWHIEHAE